MAIWVGLGGGLRLQRAASNEFHTVINEADIDVTAKRLSVDKAVGALITGDLVSFSVVDDVGILLQEPLGFVDGSGWPDGQQYSDGQWYVNVDPIGGIRLYENWAAAVANDFSKAIALVEPSKAQRLRIEVKGDIARCVAQTTSWELNTNRDVADISNLGDTFKKNMATMVSGSGQIECQFNAVRDRCVDNIQEEFSVYLHKLALRQEIGATFTGIFLLKRGGVIPIGANPEAGKLELYYKCDCVINNVVSSVNVDDYVINSNISFVTTGPISLLYDYVPDFLLQETTPDEERILQENTFGIALEAID